MRWLADENFNGRILRGLLHVRPELDIVRAQDAGLTGTPDPVLLAWAAEQDRILLTHDLRTVPRHAYLRTEQGLRMPGVVHVSRKVSIAVVIEQVILIEERGNPGEWEGRVVFLPMR